MMTALMLTVMLGFTALTIDIGLHHYLGAKLQNAVDSAGTAVAANIGSIDGSLEDVAYDYLAKNGYDRNGKYKDNLKVTIEQKGVINQATMNEEDYITTGFYKITAEVDDQTLFARVLNIDSLHLVKTSYVRAEANYVEMPRALKYTIFGGSTENSKSNPTVDFNGRTGDWVNDVTAGFADFINGINNKLVQPIIGIFGGTPNYNNLININLSEIITDGDVHSNSNIAIGVQALNASRVKDKDYTGDAQYDENDLAYDEAHEDEIKDDAQVKFNKDTNKYEWLNADYGQVTYTAATDITFDSSLRRSHNDSTHVYVQNQQALEVTQIALNIINTVDFEGITSTSTLRSRYDTAAQNYFIDPAHKNVSDLDKNAAIAQSENLSYIGEGDYVLDNQEQIVYNISQDTAEDYLNQAENGGISTLQGYINTSGNDKVFLADQLMYQNAADMSSSINYPVSFTKLDESTNEITGEAKVTVKGTTANRDITNILNGSGHTSMRPETYAGARYAIARTFQENSDYIAVPNMKPYFVRQVNQSIRNATKTRAELEELDETAGDRTIKAAVADMSYDVDDIVENTSYEDTKYADTSTYTNKNTTPLFTQYKESATSGVTYYGSNDSYHTTFKGYSLYNSNNVLRTPSDFVTEWNSNNAVNFASDAVQNYGNSISSYNNFVASKKQAITNWINTLGYSYEEQKAQAGHDINSIVKPDITAGSGDDTAAQEVFMTAAQEEPLNHPENYFLGDGNGGNVNIDATSGVRATYNTAMNGITASGLNTAATSATPNYSGFTNGGNITGTQSSSVIVLNNNYKYGRVDNPNSGGLWKTYRSTRITAGYEVAITEYWYLDTNQGKGLDIQAGTASDPTILYVAGDVTLKGDSTSNYISIGDYATLIVGGNLNVDKGQINLNGAHSKLIVKGNINSTNGGNVYVTSGAEIFCNNFYKNRGLTLEAGATISCVNEFSLNGGSGKGILENKGTIRAGGNMSIVSDKEYRTIVNTGTIYCGGTISGQYAFVNNGGTVYCLGDIDIASSGGCSNENGGNSDNAFYLINGSKTYIRGRIRTKAGLHVYLPGSGNTVLSVFGVGYNECFDGANQLYVANASAKVYLGKSVTLSHSSVPLYNAGSLYCFGNMGANNGGGATVTCTGAGITYVYGSLWANTSNISVTGGHLLYADTGSVVAVNLTVNASNVFARDQISATNITLTNGSVANSTTDVIYTNKSVDATSKIAGRVTITLSGNINYADLEKTFTGNVTANSLTLSNFKLVIIGNLNLTGNINLTNGSQVYVTGNLICGSITLDNSVFRVDGTVTCGAIDLRSKSRFHIKGNVSASSAYVDDSGLYVINQSPRILNPFNWSTFDGWYKSDMTLTGQAFAIYGGEIYVDGNLNCKRAISTGENSSILTGRALNITADYSQNSEGYITVGSETDEIFCGPHSTQNYRLGLIINGGFYHPSAPNLNVYYLDVQSTGKLILDADINVNSYAYIHQNGIFYNTAKTIINGCRFTNEGKLYMLGGVDMTNASTSSNTPDFILKDASETYIGPAYSGSTRLGTLTYKGYYEGRGDVYIENNLVINGYLGKDSKDLYNNKIKVGNRGTAVYIPYGTTYVDGYVTACDSNGILINYNCGLVMKNDFTLGSAIYNYGKLISTQGKLVLHNDNLYITDRDVGNDYNKNYTGISVLNGEGENDRGRSAVMFFGGQQDMTTFIGYVKNYGSMYMNSGLNVKGYQAASNLPVLADCAFVNYSGSNAHFSGSIYLNSNSIYNYPNSTFGCNGRFEYGGCIYNEGRFYVTGDVTTVQTNSMRADVHRDDMGTFLGLGIQESSGFALRNGAHDISVNDGNKTISNYYDQALFYCGGNMQFGTSESDGNAGSLCNFGTLYVGGNLMDYCNKVRSYFETALWLANNSNTFVGGNCFGGGGVVSGNNSILMCGGDLRSKRSMKFNVEYFGFKGGFAGITSYYSFNNDNNYTPAYVYVGGNMIANVSGKPLYNWPMDIAVRVPENNSRDLDIFSNTNVYVGGSVYANCQVWIKENVTMLVAGQKSLYKGNGQLADELFTDDINGIAQQFIRSFFYDTRNNPYVFFDYQLLDIDDCSTLVVNGGMFVKDTAKIRDMTKTYVYGDFQGGKYVELGKAQDGADETEAKEEGFLTPTDKALRTAMGAEAWLQNYKFERSPYMYVQGSFESGGDGTPTNLLENLFGSSGYTKIFASATLRVGGDMKSNKYITVRHDGGLYVGKKCAASTSIDIGSYSTVRVRGSMQASTSTIKIRDQVSCLVGGNMTALSYIELGKYGDYFRGRAPLIVYDADDAGIDSYKASNSNTDEESQGGATDYNDLIVCPNCGCRADLELMVSESGAGNKTFEKTVTIYENANDPNDEHNGEYCCGNCGAFLGEKSGKAEDDSDNRFDERALDTLQEIGQDASDLAEGSVFYIGGRLVSYTGYLKEFAYSKVVVGNYVFINKYITLRHNADLWVMPPTFESTTYEYKPYISDLTDESGFLARIWDAIKQFGYETRESVRLKNGSVYSLGELTLNKNASLMGTYDCTILGQCVLRQNSLVYMGHDFNLNAPSVNVSFDLLRGNESVVGFDTYGTATPGYRFVCNNKAEHQHSNEFSWYVMASDYSANDTNGKGQYCPLCGNKVPVYNAQSSFPVVVYADNEINIATTVSMKLTYLIANKGDVNLYDIYTNTENAENNAKELPNAISSYQGNINYNAMYGNMGALFYAPYGTIDFDGYYLNIWGSAVGNKVKVDSYYLAMHRFTNWRTMQLNVVESGTVYIIPESEYEKAVNNVDDIYNYEKWTGHENQTFVPGDEQFYDFPATTTNP